MCEISVGIAAYNVANYLEECLNSVIQQDFDDYEIIIVNDKSTDGSKDLAERIIEAHKDKIIRIINHPINMGIGCVRNTFIKNAEGKYLFFIDGDDFISPNTLSLLYNKMKEVDTEIVTANHCVFFDGEDIINGENTNFIPGTIKESFALAKWCRENKTWYYPVALWNKLWKKEFILQHDLLCLPQHTRQEDIFFTFKASFYISSIATVKDTTLYWRMRKGSAINTVVNELLYNQYLNIFDVSMAFLKDYKKSHQNTSIPGELLSLVTGRFLGGFLMMNTMKSVKIDKKKKKEFLRHISTISNYISYNELQTKTQKIVYLLLKPSCRYTLINNYIKTSPSIKKIMAKLR